jgi:hypothetical protein
VVARKRLFLSLALLVSSGATDGAQSSSLMLAGLVPPVLSVTLSAASAQNVQRLLASTSREGVEIARLIEVNNTFGSYTVAITSRNGGRLTEGAEGIGYELFYNDKPVDLRAGEAIVASGPRESGTSTTHVLRVRLAAGPDAPKPEAVVNGRFADTITFSVAAP